MNIVMERTKNKIANRNNMTMEIILRLHKMGSPKKDST